MHHRTLHSVGCAALGLGAIACTSRLGEAPTLGETSSTASSSGAAEPDTSSSSGESHDSIDGSSGESGTGEDTDIPIDPCAVQTWPNDGSEVIELVEQVPVDDWYHYDGNIHYRSFLTEMSPIPGTQARGLASVDGAPGPYYWGATVSGVSAVPYRGQRVRMRALVGLKDVEHSASLWLRLDEGEAALALDNPLDHPDWGTSADWEIHEAVMDVPVETEGLAFGSLLIGPGTIVVGAPSFEIVTDEVPTTMPNRRQPPTALGCFAPTDDAVVEVFHYTRPDVWYDFENEEPVPDLALARDEDVTHDGVPTLHVAMHGSAVLGDSLTVWWPSEAATRRVRLTLPVRAELTGDVQLFLDVYDGDELAVSRIIAPVELPAGDVWTPLTVVAEVPASARIGIDAGVVADGAGELWLGYGVIEHVTEDVPLSPLAE